MCSMPTQCARTASTPPPYCSPAHAPQPIGAMRVRLVLLAAAAALLLAAGAEARRCSASDYECVSKRQAS